MERGYELPSEGRVTSARVVKQAIKFLQWISKVYLVRLDPETLHSAQHLVVGSRFLSDCKTIKIFLVQRKRN